MKISKVVSFLIVLLVFSACSMKGHGNNTVPTENDSVTMIDGNVTYSTKVLPAPENGSIISAVAWKEKMYYILDSTIYTYDPSTEKHSLLIDETAMSSDANAALAAAPDALWVVSGNEEKVMLRAFDESGVEVRRIEDLPNINGLPSDMCIDGSGNIYLLQSDEILVIDKNGELVFELSPSGVVVGLYSDGNGNVYTQIFDGPYGYLYQIDNKRQVLSEMTALPQDAVFCFDGDEKYSLYYRDNSKLYGLNIDTGKSVVLLDWLECGINPTSVFLLVSISGDDFLCIAYGLDGNIMLYYLVAGDEIIGGKKTLKMAVFLPDYYLTEAVLAFNRENEEYRIETIDYSSTLHGMMPFTGGNMDDTMQTRLLLDIMIGDVPDIIDVSMLSVRRYAEKGLFEDLYYYLDNDPELSRDDILPNVSELLETDGKLYQTLSAFVVRTAIGNSDVVGHDIGWTWDDIKNIIGDYKSIFFKTQEPLLDDFIYIYAENFIDWKTGVCSFDSPEFIHLLNVVKSHPGSNELDFSQPWNNDYLLRALFVDSILDLQSYRYRIDGEFTFKGYPLEKGGGNTIYPSSTQLAITTTSKYKDAAWSFVRQVLTEEYQSEKRLWRIAYPTNTAAFEKYLKDAMTPIYNVDGDDNEVELPKGTKLVGEEIISLYAASESDCQEFIELLNSCNRIDRADAAVYNIMWDECRAFFAGDKTAEETAKLIQSRVSIYISEQQ